MSDYSFMRSGFTNLEEPSKLSEQDTENLEIMLALFTSNALINASKYVEYCQRNGVTQMDVLYGLIYEVFEFLNRKDLNEGMDEIREEYYKMYELSDEEEEEEDTNIAEKDFGELNELIVPDSEIENFNRISEDKINDINKDFIEKFHHYYDTWDDWTPETPLQISLRNAINKIK